MLTSPSSEKELNVTTYCLTHIRTATKEEQVRTAADMGEPCARLAGMGSSAATVNHLVVP